MMTVSVVLPLYNSEKYIGEAINSVLNQTFQDFELLVIDDGSIDCSVEIVNKYSDKRIKLYRRDHFGLINSLNYGISQAKGKLIARFDNDDICLPDRLKKQVDFLDHHPEVGVLSGGAYLIDSKGRQGKKAVKMHHLHNDIVFSLENFSNSIYHPTVMIRKSILISNGGYRKEFPVAEDYELWLRMLRNGVRFECLPEPIVKIRRHESNMSATKFKSSTQSCLRAFFEHIFWRRKGIDLAGISLASYDSVIEQALELLDTTCLTELLCWRHDLAEKTKICDANAVFGFVQCLFNQNKRAILLRKRGKVVSAICNIVDKIDVLSTI